VALTIDREQGTQRETQPLNEKYLTRSSWLCGFKASSMRVKRGSRDCVLSMSVVVRWVAKFGTGLRLPRD